VAQTAPAAEPAQNKGTVAATASGKVEGKASKGKSTPQRDAAPVGQAAGEGATSVSVSPKDEEERAMRLRSQVGLRGSTGLLRLQGASSAPEGTFRVGYLGSYMTTTGFLCPQCEALDGGDPSVEDDVSRVTANVQLNATVLPYLEAYVAVHSTATSNSRGEPAVLQTLGDTTWGVKGFMPYKPGQVLSAGGALELWMLNGAGSVAIDNASVAVRALGTADFTNRSKASERLPLRVHVNLSYVFDNSGQLVEAEEDRRNRRITRIERFGLNINRVDQFVPAFGVEGVFEYVNPFIEWSVDIPSNRQRHACAPSKLSAGDECLDAYGQFTAAPARLTLGARGYALLDGLSGILALDIATGGVNAPFWEEMQPEAPWNLFFGLSYAVDTRPKVVERVVTLPAPAPQAETVAANLIQGRVVEEGTADVPVAGAVVRYDGLPLTGMVADEQGRFETRPLPLGDYRFGVSAGGYESGTCAAKIEAAAAEPGPAAPEAENGEPAPNVTHVVCQLKAKPKVGNIDGAITAPAGKPLADAKVTVTDKLGRSLSLQVDASGAFRFENVPPGQARVQIAANGYLATSRTVEVPPGQDLRLSLELAPVPVPANVVLANNTITLRKPIQFRTGSKELLPDASPLLDELASLLLARPEAAEVEVQVHTSNESPSVVNMQLSQQRAEAVVAQLVDRGVPAARLRGQGYGDSQPIAPNTTEFGRKKNERVQLVVTPGAK
jgi:outer membrane protein OmpA-like peptidoglycan-associated protein